MSSKDIMLLWSVIAISVAIAIGAATGFESATNRAAIKAGLEQCPTADFGVNAIWVKDCEKFRAGRAKRKKENE